ncbi:reprolysin-like metallopeptidase [Flavobacterium hauense]
MKKRLLMVMASAMFFSAGYTQNAIWNRADGKSIPQSALMDRASVPSQYHLFSLDLQGLKSKLANAPMRGSNVSSAVVIQFPDGNGQLKSFKVYEAPVMQPGLAAKYPNSKSYVGQGIENPSQVIRLSITRYGLHTMLSTDEGTAYTDPYTKDGLTSISYKRAAVTPRTFRCDVTEVSKKDREPQMAPFSVTATDGQLRTYRLAMSCTVEYAAFHIQEADLTAGTIEEQTEAVLAAMVVTVTRVNSVYEKDFAVSLQLIDNNDELIFITADTYDNENTDNALLNASQGVIDGIVGFDSYDIGHVVSTGGGGVAQLWSPCSDSKARGITGLGAPVGDPYDIDFVAHEMGHQFGGNHTFNNECGGNRSDETAYEPGSGSTIMAYAGVCSPNVQDHSDAHFHKHSIVEITDFIKGWGDCSVNVQTGNLEPTVDAGPDRTIPKGTPFMLKATGGDVSVIPNALTYCWEQMDLEISLQPPVADATEGPNFRSLPPTTSPVRYMPSLSSVLANNLAPTWEVVSNVERDFNFVVTVRDNDPLGGQTAYDDVLVHVSGVAGPFLVTSPNTNVSWQAGSNQTITWNVAGTTANGVDAAYVDILMSNDGGLTYPVVLAAKVPNDGSEIITVPTGNGNNKRIMVRGYDHIFYDISNSNFTVTSAPSTMAISVVSLQNRVGCIGSQVTYNMLYQALSGFTGETTFALTGAPEGSVVTFTPNTISETDGVDVTVATPANAVPGFYSMTVTATSGSISKMVSVYLEIIDSSFGEIVLMKPANGVTDIPSIVHFEWNAIEDAGGYIIQIATDEQFENIVLHAVGIGNRSMDYLENNTTYYWKIQPVNATCTGNSSEVFSFTTGVTTCNDHMSGDVPATISSDEEAAITSAVMATGTNPIDKVMVYLTINHNRVKDLTAVLKSPAGTEITLFQNVCHDGAMNIATFFDDYGHALMDCGTNPAIGGYHVMPASPLSVLNGQTPQGTWTLTVSDTTAGVGGQLVSWGLNICSTGELPVSGVAEQSFAGLTVSPNPNRGDFMVQFTSVTGNDIQIAVYDIGGRRLLNETFANTGLIQQPISLSHAQAGVYLVNIHDGDNIVIKKIIIE